MMETNNPFKEIPASEIQYFKEKVQRWLHVDTQIASLQNQIKELRKVKNKELEPEITEFMTNHNVLDLNTENGKLRCQEKKTKKGLTKQNIRENLSKLLEEPGKLDKAMEAIEQRPVVISYKLKKLKK
tara:strand:+ start:174 stop:557 length:384 start_codon:yes stop_codon:yes gene_type:complete